jgi:hypothetical protein
MLRTSGLCLLAALFGAHGVSVAADFQFVGAITGIVKDSAGKTRMGASVVLYNRYERMLQRTYSDPSGRFRFDGLLPDNYSVRVTLSTFVPAGRSQIPVRAGMESFLSIQLATIFSSIELVYTAPGQNGLLSDDWKWVLRSASSTRPVLRALPRVDPAATPGISSSRQHTMFSVTRGLMRVSGGDAGASSFLGHEPDLGTAFALATTLFGASELHVLGNVGYATSTGTPAAAFRTRFMHTGDPGGMAAPDFELTVRQIGLRQRVGQGLVAGAGSTQEIPLLRTMSIKSQDHAQLSDELSIDYGALLEAVEFLDRVTIFSPFARLTYDLGEAGVVEAGYSNGAPALDLMTTETGDSSLAGDMIGLAMFPRVSLLNGKAEVQRSRNFEASYRKALGANTLAIGAYHEDVRNAAVTMAAPAGTFSTADLLPDISSRSSIFNMGSWSSNGAMVSATRDFGEQWSGTLAYGVGGALGPVSNWTAPASADDFRSSFRPVRRQWASARFGGSLRTTGTRLVAAYVWTPSGTLAPTHAWITQRWTPQLGLNIQVRQPLPEVSLLPGRFEMTAEVRNLLAQGYLPVSSADGHSIYLIQFPRSLRGGFSFIF